LWRCIERGSRVQSHIAFCAACRLSWAAALYDWLRVTDDRVLVVLKRIDMQCLAAAPSQAAARSMFDFVVLSYDLLKDVASLLDGLAFQVVILDESHCIKNPKVRYPAVLLF
jgi:hypothetical protein